MASEVASDKVYSVLQAFQPILKSIDMRTIAVWSQAGEEWENLVTSIVVSEKSADEVRIEQSKLPKLDSQIKLFTFAGDFDFCAFEGFARGEIGQKWVVIPKVGGYAYRTVRIKTRQFDPLDLKLVSSQRRIADVWKWVLTATGLNSSPDREQLWTTVHNQTIVAKQLGYAEMKDLLRDVFRMDYIPHNVDFELTIADLTKIKNIVFDVTSFEVEIEKVVGLKDLQLNVEVERTIHGGFSKNVLTQGFPIDKGEEKQIGKNCVLNKTVPTPPLFPYDSVELELIHKNSALTLDRTRERVPLQNIVEPFLKVLGDFCSIDMFKEMLLKPENFKKAPELIFENAVAWLLSLAGFHTVYLSANSKTTKVVFDVLRKDGGYQIGSADIIAYEDNERLLLIDCDISGLDEKKIQKLIEICEHFKALCDYGELKFVPVLFTPRYFGEDMKQKPVAVVDGNVIESILEDLAKGDRESARSKIQCYSWGSIAHPT